MLKNSTNDAINYYSKPKLIYGYDTLCGWCYGFSSEIEKTVSYLHDFIDFELYNGGLFAGVKGPKMGYINAHIRRNMSKVTLRTGKEFGEGFQQLLESIHYPYNSMRASVAIEVVKELAPNKVLRFASDIQRSFFEFGADIQSDHFYSSLVKRYHLDSQQFMNHFHSDYFDKKAKAAFVKTNTVGFEGFPAVALQFGYQYKIISEGYTTADNLIALVQKELKKDLILPSKI